MTSRPYYDNGHCLIVRDCSPSQAYLLKQKTKSGFLFTKHAVNLWHTTNPGGISKVLQHLQLVLFDCPVAASNYCSNILKACSQQYSPSYIEFEREVHYFSSKTENLLLIRKRRKPT